MTATEILIAGVTIYREGPVCCSVCAPSELPLDELTEAVNNLAPTGINSRWQPSADERFASGETNPCPCERRAGFSHYLFNC